MTLDEFYRGLGESGIRARLATPLLEAERVVAVAELQRRERLASGGLAVDAESRQQSPVAGASSRAGSGARFWLNLAAWFFLCYVFRKLVDKWMYQNHSDTPLFDSLIAMLIAMLLASSVVTAAGLFRRSTPLRVILRLAAIVFMLAPILPLVILSSLFVRGHGQARPSPELQGRLMK